MVKLYKVELNDRERAELAELVHAGNAPAQIQTRARILLLADVEQGYRDVDIAKALFTSLSTVHRTRLRLVTEGLHSALHPKPRSGRPPIFGGEVEAHLTALACASPPQGRARWSLRLLADTLVELHVVESISPSHVRNTLKKTSCVPGE
jgi:transposase